MTAAVLDAASSLIGHTLRAMEKAELIWKNGEFVPWDEANVHVLSHGLHYGTGVFEGIRCYDTEARARRSSATATTSSGSRSRPSSTTSTSRHSLEEIREATKELIRRNGLRSLLHPPARLPRLRRDGPVRAKSAPIDVIVAVWPWGAYLGEEGKREGHPRQGLSWRRISPAGLIPHAKASGQYLNSILAKTESANAGYDEAILLDERGFVCEGSGENIFVIRDGEIVTPPHAAVDPRRDQPQVGDADRRATSATRWSSATSRAPSSTWPTRSSSPAPRPSWCPVREIDDHDLGEPGEITRVIQAKFEDALHGRAEEYLEWLDPVGEPTGEATRAPKPGEVEAE